MKKISIFGLGYVGCVSAACFADAGHTVIGIDPNQEKVRMVNSGWSPIVEPGLNTLLAEVVERGNLSATGSCEEAVQASDVAFICVGTPGNEHGQLQLDALRQVSRQIGEVLKRDPKPYTVVVRSTVLPGTTERDIRSVLLDAAGDVAGALVRVAVNPEFIREGSALKDFANPPYTLIGSEDRDTIALLQALYSSVSAPDVVTGIKTAEAIKYVSNTYHALKICFANEVGDVCSALGVDSQEVMHIFRMDTKLNISGAYLQPGFAFGGSCLPKDVRAFRYAASHLDVPTPLLDAIVPSNEWQIQRAIDMIVAQGKKHVGVVGLSFKSGTDDLRESPMVRVVEALIGKGFSLRVLDNNVSIASLMGANRQYINEEIPHIASLMCESRDEFLAHSELVVLGNYNDESVWVAERLGADQQLVDLSRIWMGGAQVRGSGSRVAA